MQPAAVTSSPQDSSAAPRDALAILAAQQATTALSQRVQQLLAGMWDGLSSWREDQIAAFVAQAVALMGPALRQAALFTAVGLQKNATANGVHLVRDLPAGYVRDGVDMATVYERAFHDVWRELAADASLESAVKTGRARLLNRAATDLQLAKTQTARAMVSPSDKVVGYRRVLEGTYSCGLCIVASTQRYHKADLMPIHPGCDCSIEPIYGHRDPGRLLNLAGLQDVHAAIEGTFGANSTAARAIPGLLNGKGEPGLYRDVIVQHTHGEIGPVIAVRKTSHITEAA